MLKSEDGYGEFTFIVIKAQLIPLIKVVDCWV